MSERAALLRAILNEPNEDTVRLAFADWCQENGEEERAEFIRVQIELAKMPYMGRRQDDPRYVLPHPWELLRRRERELFANRCRVWFPNPTSHEWKWQLPGDTGTYKGTCTFTRGFVSAITLTQADFLKPGVAEGIFRAHPVTSVTLSDREPLVGANGRAWWLRTPGPGGPWLEDDGCRDSLAADLYDAVISVRRKSGEPYDQSWLFDGPADARRWLSDGAVHYGRERAGLPPLSTASIAPATSTDVG